MDTLALIDSLKDTVATSSKEIVDTTITAVNSSGVVDTLEANAEVVTGLTSSGLLFMIIAWTAIIGLTLFCFKKTLSESEEKIVGPLEVEAEMDAEEKE